MQVKVIFQTMLSFLHIDFSLTHSLCLFHSAIHIIFAFFCTLFRNVQSNVILCFIRSCSLAYYCYTVLLVPFHHLKIFTVCSRYFLLFFWPPPIAHIFISTGLAQWNHSIYSIDSFILFNSMIIVNRQWKRKMTKKNRNLVG